jgi:hypothetical protein
MVCHLFTVAGFELKKRPVPGFNRIIFQTNLNKYLVRNRSCLAMTLKDWKHFIIRINRFNFSIVQTVPATMVPDHVGSRKGRGLWWSWLVLRMRRKIIISVAPDCGVSNYRVQLQYLTPVPDCKRTILFARRKNSSVRVSSKSALSFGFQSLHLGYCLVNPYCCNSGFQQNSFLAPESDKHNF